MAEWFHVNMRICKYGDAPEEIGIDELAEALEQAIDAHLSNIFMIDHMWVGRSTHLTSDQIQYCARKFEDVRKPRLKKDWEDRLVMTRCDMETKGGTHFPAGTIMRVERNYGGLHLSVLKRCPHCEVSQRHRISKVREGDVILLPRDFDVSRLEV